MRIALIGCGKMGAAMLDKWLASDLVDAVDVVKPSTLSDTFNKDPKVRYFNSVDAYARAETAAPDLVVLAVKPSDAEKVCAGLKNHIPKDAVVLSIMTGKTLGFFEDHFGAEQPVIRAMPNTPSQIGKGITVAVAGAAATPAHLDTVTEILKMNGQALFVQDESLINVVAAISGSGPAYFNLFAEQLARAGEELGLPPALAMMLARQTLVGTGAMAESFPDKTLEDLRLQVTSPGGSTAEAVKSYLAKDSLLDAQRDAVVAAAAKNELLGNAVAAPLKRPSPAKP